MRRIFLFSVIVLLLGLVSFGYAEGVTKQQGMTSELYIGVYTATDRGRVELPREAKWNVRTAYIGIDKRGKRYKEDCVCLVLNDAEKSFWPVIVKMDMLSAQGLVDQLEEVWVIMGKSSGLDSAMAPIQCVLNTGSYEVTRKGKIVLPENTHWRVVGRYADVVPGKERVMEDHILLFLEEKQERKKKVRPFVCKMSMASVADLVSGLNRVMSEKMQLASGSF